MAAVEEESTTELKNSSSTDLIASYGMRTQKCEGFWIQANTIPVVKVTQREFQPQHDDIFLASLPKTVTTWCKALLHTIVQFWTKETNFKASVEDRSPHSLVPTMEAYLFDSTAEHQQYDASIFSKFPLLRVLQTHFPLSLLPPPIRSSACKIVYIARNPRDVSVSHWKFFNKLHEDELSYSNGDLSKEALFDGLCSGFFHGGLFAASVLSYWHESRWDPNKVMFFTYEDVQADCVGCVKKLGLFLGCSPQLMEEDAAVIAEKCSSQSLSTAEVNKTSRGLENKI